MYRYILSAISYNRRYAFFSNTYGTLTKINHILQHKGKISRPHKVEIIQSISFNHSEIKLKIKLNVKKVLSK